MAVGRPTFLTEYAEALGDWADLRARREVWVTDPFFAGGAKGNGSDDADAFQAAIDFLPDGGTIRVPTPAVKYMIGRTLNCTDRNGLVIEGDSQYSTLIEFGPGVARGLDFTASEYSGTRRLKIQGSTSLAVAQWHARGSNPGQQYAQFCFADDVFFNLSPNPTLNGGKGSVAIYNNAAELFWTSPGCVFYAGTPIVDAANNALGIDSSFVVRDGTQFLSNSTKTYRGSFIATVGYALWLSASWNVDASHSYLYNPNYGSGTGQNPTKYAIFTQSFCNDLQAENVHVEGFPGVLHDYLTVLTRPKLSGTFYATVGVSPIHMFGFQPNPAGIDLGGESVRLRSLTIGTITAVNQGAKKFTLSGDWVARLNSAGAPVRVFESAANNGNYTVVSATLVGGNTEVVVSEAIPSATADGRLGLVYSLVSTEPFTSATHYVGFRGGDVSLGAYADFTFTFSDRTGLDVYSPSADATINIGTDDASGSVSGSVTKAGVTTRKGAHTFAGALTVAGAATLQSTLGVTGAATLASVGVTGNATVGGTLGVTGTSVFTGAATFGSTLGISGTVTITPSATAIIIGAGGTGVAAVFLGPGAGYFQKQTNTPGDLWASAVPPAATSGATTRNGAVARLGTAYWNGSASVIENVDVQPKRGSTTAGDVYLSCSAKFTCAAIGVGNSAAATTLGTLAKKMEVFDASGASLGFVPIYTTIT